MTTVARAPPQVTGTLRASTLIKTEQGEREYISCMIEIGKGKCACGKLIDQADSVISFVIVIACVDVCVCECVQNRAEIGETE